MSSQIALFLMTFKGLQVLRSIIECKLTHLIFFVNIGRDKDVQDDYSKEISELCRAHGLTFYYRNEVLPIIEMRYIIAISWRWMINAENTRIIVLHDSLLPKYRGFAPLVNALKNGEPKIGVTALFASDRYDEGPVISQRSLDVKYPIKINKAIEYISKLYQEIIVDLLRRISNGIDIQSYAQNDSEVSYSLWLDEDDYFVKWEWDSQYIERFVNATGFPFDGAKAFIGSRMIWIQEVQILRDFKIENRAPGKILYIDSDYKPVIVCGSGILKLMEANYLDGGESVFPFKKLRTKFK